MHNWKLFLLPGSANIQTYSKQTERAFKSWHQVWSAAFEEVGIEKKLFSDEFTRQDDVMALFEGDKCLASLFFRNVDLSQDLHRMDSYFAEWPELAVQRLMRDSQHICVGSQTTVIPEARGRYKQISMKRLLLALLVQYCIHNDDSSAVTAAMRNAKGMQKVGCEAGATLLQADVPVHGEPTDLMAFYKKDLLNFKHQYHELASRLWNGREDWKQTVFRQVGAEDLPLAS